MKLQSVAIEFSFLRYFFYSEGIPNEINQLQFLECYLNWYNFPPFVWHNHSWDIPGTQFHAKSNCFTIFIDLCISRRALPVTVTSHSTYLIKYMLWYQEKQHIKFPCGYQVEEKTFWYHYYQMRKFFSSASSLFEFAAPIPKGRTFLRSKTLHAMIVLLNWRCW